MGPQGAGYVQAFTQMTDQELQKANELFQVSLMLPDATAANIISSYTKAGLNAAKGLGDGITSGTEEVVGASEDLGEESLDAVDTTLDEHSPSRKTHKMGEYFDEGLKLGISENKDKILTVIKMITSEMLDKTKEGIPENYHNIGIQITEGLRSGIEAGRSAVIEAMRALCMETIQTAKSTLDINSPSKKFDYLGEMSGQGYITGWERSMQNIDSIIMDTMPDLPSGAANNIAGAQAITNMQFPDALMSKMEQMNANILDTCGKMYNMMMQYMPEMANMQMVTDTGVLIGELIPGIDSEFGNMESDKERGVY